MSEKRDLAADLKICEKATKGPWEIRSDAPYSAHGFKIFRGRGKENKTIAHFPYGNVIGLPKGWEQRDKTYQQLVANVQFIAAAREGWPHAIRRAMEAEEEVKRLREDMNFLQQEYRDSEEPMTQDALELKARLKILQERDELRAEVRRLKIEIAVLTNTPTGKDIVTAYKQAEAENASLKEELEQAEAALGEAVELLKYVAEMNPLMYDDAKTAKECAIEILQNPTAKAASERWRAMEDFDVLLCINEATKWPDPPPMDERWIKAICKAADLVKQGMLAAYEGVKGDE